MTDERTLRVEVVTPDGEVYRGDVEMVVLPGVEGELGILARHQPLVTLLRIGETRIKKPDGEYDRLATGIGYAEVLFAKVIVVVDHGELAGSDRRGARRTGRRPRARAPAASAVTPARAPRSTSIAPSKRSSAPRTGCTSRAAPFDGAAPATSGGRGHRRLRGRCTIRPAARAGRALPGAHQPRLSGSAPHRSGTYTSRYSMDGSFEHRGRLLVQGGNRLNGEVVLSGAKNSALKLMAASLLTAEPCTIRRVPSISDVATMADMLRALGATIARDGDTMTVTAGGGLNGCAPYELVRTMRASIIVMGPLVARLGEASIAMPGGLQHRAPPHRLPPAGPRAVGRLHRDRARLHQGARPTSCTARWWRSTTRASAPPRTC